MASNTEWESGQAEQLTEENGDSGRARFQKRLAGHYDELKRLYMELYGREDMFEELCREMYAYFAARKRALRERDDAREREPDWFCRRDMLGMMLYIDNFAGNLRGVQEKLPYLEECHVNYVHLMPFLDSPKGRSDGGYAVADFRKVRPDLGTMEDLARLADACHERDMNVCMDFVMNHTSEDHAWAKRARKGDAEYRSRYFFYDTIIPTGRTQANGRIPDTFTGARSAGTWRRARRTLVRCRAGSSARWRSWNGSGGRTWEEGRFRDLVRESSLEMKEVVLAPHDFLWAVKEI